MFCSECGQEASGKFCSSCGHRLHQLPQDTERAGDEFGPIDWTTLTDYTTMIGIPEVRDRIAQHAHGAKKKLTGEEFLECCDKVLTPLTGGVPLAMIAKFTQPISEKLGLKTGQARVQRLAEPPGKVLVAVLSSLAENNQQLGEVTQLPNGCIIRAAMPSDLWSLKGDLIVTVRYEGNTTLDRSRAHNPGSALRLGQEPASAR